MGVVRIVLALAVVLGHTADPSIFGFKLLTGTFAVEAFFILSGFYMALILDRTYRGPGAYGAFMANRALRLFPIYWVVLVMTIPVVFIAGDWRDISSPRPSTLGNTWFVFPQLLDFASLLLLIPSHLLLVGQEFVYFFAIDPNGMYNIREFAARQEAFKNSLPLFAFLMVPQAWSLSLELMFYAIAPFLVRQRTRWVVALMLFSLTIRGWIYLQPTLSYTTFMYKFFPAELWTFTAGVLAFRLYQSMQARNLPAARIAPVAAALPLLALTYAYLPWMPVWVLLPLVALLIPALFATMGAIEAHPRWARLARVDRLLGDLSYPVYISHILVLQVLYTFAPGLPRRLSHGFTPAVIVITLGASYALLRLVGDPVERIRSRNRQFAARHPDRAARRREERRKQTPARRKAPR